MLTSNSLDAHVLSTEPTEGENLFLYSSDASVVYVGQQHASWTISLFPRGFINFLNFLV